MTTIELIVDEQDWMPGVIIPRDRQVFIRIGYGETELREQVKQAGGYWNVDEKALRLPYNRVLAL